MNATELAQAVFAKVDAMDTAGFAALLTENASFVFGNFPTAEGRAGATEAVDNFFAGIDGISHDIQEVWEDGDSVIVRLAVTYHRKDGQSVTLPCANIWKREGNLISDYRIYMDVNPVFA